VRDGEPRHHLHVLDLEFSQYFRDIK